MLALSDVERKELLDQGIFKKTSQPPHLIHFTRVKRFYNKLVLQYNTVFLKIYEEKLQKSNM